MSLKNYIAVSYRKVGLCTFMLMVLIFWGATVLGQDIKILKTNGMIAVIGEGTTGGLQQGDYVLVKRFINDSWKNITYAVVTHVRSSMSRIKVSESAPQLPLKLGDVVEKINMNSLPVAKKSAPDKPTSVASPVNKNNKLIYLGPTAGAFIPLGDMKDVFQNSVGYGGILGIRFRQDLDVSMRFFYTAEGSKWSFWNVELLGRRYYGGGFLVDFGYGICYPEIASGAMGFSNGGETIRLGFIGGFGFTFPVALSTRFEIGGLFHYYPHFGDKTGNFITAQGRLIL